MKRKKHSHKALVALSKYSGLKCYRCDEGQDCPCWTAREDKE